MTHHNHLPPASRQQDCHFTLSGLHIAVVDVIDEKGE
jgi:hypothetical protein